MGRDIFYDLSETISRTARDIGEKADIFIETQKLQSRAGAERRLVEKCMKDLGNIIHKRYVAGEALDEELAIICEEITRRQTVIASYKEEYARLKGRKICPECGESIDRYAAYCPKCGAVCPDTGDSDITDEEPKEKQESQEAETPEAEETPEESSLAHTASEAEETQEKAETEDGLKEVSEECCEETEEK